MFGWLVTLFLKNCCTGEDVSTSYVKAFLKAKYYEMGPMMFKEFMVVFYFLLLIFIWFFAEPSFMEGWSDWFKTADGGHTVCEATPAVLILILILITPAKLNFWPFVDYSSVNSSADSSSTIMDWRTLSQVVRVKYFSS